MRLTKIKTYISACKSSSGWLCVTRSIFKLLGKEFQRWLSLLLVLARISCWQSSIYHSSAVGGLFPSSTDSLSASNIITVRILQWFSSSAVPQTAATRSARWMPVGGTGPAPRVRGRSPAQWTTAMAGCGARMSSTAPTRRRSSRSISTFTWDPTTSWWRTIPAVSSCPT